jgi:hypothetical protein
VPDADSNVLAMKAAGKRPVRQPELKPKTNNETNKRKEETMKKENQGASGKNAGKTKGKTPKEASRRTSPTTPKEASRRTSPTTPKEASSSPRATDPEKTGAQLQRERDYTIRWLDPWMLETPHVNDELYGKTTDDPDLDALTESVKRYGILTPLIVNREGYIASGNRRRSAACRAGLHEVPCYVWDVKVHTDEFDHLLVDANENRVKGASAQLAELGIKGSAENPEIWLGMQRVKAERRERCGGMAAVLDVLPRKRKEIVVTREFANAVIEVVNAELEHGRAPTLRQVHYLLLNDPPVRNTRTGNRYKNNPENYKALSEIAGRLRVFGELPFDSIIDSGRTLFMPQTYAHAGEYVEKWLHWFGGDYRRNIMRSQSAFFAVCVEKEAMGEFFRRHVERTYPGACVVVCRGKVSHSLIHELHTAFNRSGKERMVLLAFADCDTDGLEIVNDLPKKLLEQGLREDEFAVVHCGLTHEQAKAFNARPQPLKNGSKSQATKARKFVERTGHDAGFELEAVPPGELLNILDDEMAARMDVAAYNAEVEAMPGDAKALMDAQRKLYAALKPGACGK